MRFSLALSALCAIALLDCSVATGSLVGGDSLNLGTGTTPSDDASTPTGDGGLAFVVTSAACLPGGMNGGNGWADLYACYFGPAPGAVSSCSVSTGYCHGAPGDPGTGIISNGYVCSPTDAMACWQSMTSSIVSAGVAPTSTTLYSALRKTDGSGTMPLNPIDLVFQNGDLARITAWIQAGAQNN